MTLKMLGLDIFVRTTDENGAKSKSQHVVWDKDRFMAARQREAKALNERHSSTKARVDQITEQEYRTRP